MNKNLIILRAGDKSLHENWLVGSSLNFDLVVLYYGDREDLNWSDHLIKMKGSKWTGIANYLNSTQDWHRYDYICFPDDDLLCTGDDWSNFFDIVRDEKLPLSQPSLARNSYYSFLITLQIPQFKLRHTNFVEVMMPCMSLEFLKAALPDFSIGKSGWGMDFYWPHLLRTVYPDARPAIVDAVSVLHTRPVGSAGNGGADSPQEDKRKFLSMKGVAAEKKRTFSAVLPNGGESSKIYLSMMVTFYKIKSVAFNKGI